MPYRYYQNKADIEDGQYFSRRREPVYPHPASFAADEVVAVVNGDIILNQPQYHADGDKYRCQHRRFPKVNGSDGGIAVNIRGEYIKTDAPSQGIGSAVFRKGFHEHQQGPYDVVPCEEGKEYLPEPPPIAGTGDGGSLFQGGRDVEHGVFHENHHEGEYMKAHDQYQPPECEEQGDPIRKGRDHLGEESPFLHEENPPHGRDVGGRHEGDKK